MVKSYLYDYDEVAALLGYSPSYIKWLCDKGKLGYIVKTWRYGVYKRRRRYIPYAELLNFWGRKFQKYIR